MKAIIKNSSPALMEFTEYTPAELIRLKSILTYHDRSAEFQYQKFRHAHWYLNKYGEEAFQEELKNKKAAIQRCILFEDEGTYTTYSGLATHLKAAFSNLEIENCVEYPETGLIPWKNKPFDLRPYQADGVGKMIAAKHSATEKSTGLGKSREIIEVIKRLGLKTVVMAPLASIADQLYKEMVSLFGEKYVGFYGAGKKVSKKLITVGIYASLTKIEPGEKAWDELSSAKVLIVDESHQVPAASLEKVCMGLCASAPYRFFFSATQMRGDGAELVLKGITGPIVSVKNFAEGVQEGYLARPSFRMIRVPSRNGFHSRDANEMTRCHLYYNSAIAKVAGTIAESAVEKLGHQVLILIQEVEQFGMLLPHFRRRVGFAHGGLTKENKGKVPEAYWDSDPSDLVKQLNEGKLPILVGTSCIAMGVDIRTPKTIIYLMGGASEVKVKQAVGRGTRKPEGKDHFYFFDFMPVLPQDEEGDTRWSVPYRHAQERLEYYRDLYPDVEVIDGF